MCGSSMRNGSKSEYFRVEGMLELTRMRQSEWRRRWGIANIVEFDTQVAASADDAWSKIGEVGMVLNNPDLFFGRDAGGSPYASFCWWDNITIPGGATVQTAYLTTESRNSSTDGTGVKTDITFNDVDDAVQPTDGDDLDAKVSTAASVAWDDVDFLVDTPTNSPSIVDVVQEILDRGSWASGNAMMVLLIDDVSDDNKIYRQHTYDSDTSKAMKLHVEYTA